MTTTKKGLLASGIVAAAAATAPPAHALAEDSFAAHMIQHLVLMIVAAPLLAVGATVHIRVPLTVAAAAYAVVVWGWHAPAAYTAAVERDVLHVAEHASFVAVSWLLWRVVFDARHGYVPRIAVVFVTGLQSSALGAILAFASIVLYPVHDPGRFGLTPLEDQQLAGAIMWIPPGLVYLVTIVALLFAWFSRMDDVVVEAGDR